MNLYDKMGEEINTVLNWLGIPDELFYFLLGLTLFIYFVLRVRKIDKNENIFKIMFSEKYDDAFGGYRFGNVKERHYFIMEFFIVLTTTIGIFIFLIIF